MNVQLYTMNIHSHNLSYLSLRSNLALLREQRVNTVIVSGKILRENGMAMQMGGLEEINTVVATDFRKVGIVRQS